MNICSEIFTKCEMVAKNKMSQEDFNEYMKTIEVRHYIPIVDLFLLTLAINVNEITKKSESVFLNQYALQAEIRSSLQYVSAKLDMEFDESILTYDVYDYIEMSGLMDFLINDNKRQYEKYCEIVRHTLDINAVSVIGDLSESLISNASDLNKLYENPIFKEALDKLEPASKGEFKQNNGDKIH